MNRTFFKKPAQVKYWNPWDKIYTVGIAWENHIINAETGEVFTTTSVEQMAPEDKDAIIPYEIWVPFNEEIGD